MTFAAVWVARQGNIRPALCAVSYCTKGRFFSIDAATSSDGDTTNSLERISRQLAFCRVSDGSPKGADRSERQRHSARGSDSDEGGPEGECLRRATRDRARDGSKRMAETLGGSGSRERCGTCCTRPNEKPGRLSSGTGCLRVKDSNQTLGSRRCESQPCVIGRNK